MASSIDFDAKAKIEFCMQKIVELEQRIRMLESERFFPFPRLGPPPRLEPRRLEPRRLDSLHMDRQTPNYTNYS